jgi:hypothetical protein
MKEDRQELYIVPFDFTPATEVSMRFGIKMSEGTGGKILLLHLVKHEDDIIEAEQKLVLVISHLESSVHDRMLYKVMKGNILEDIDKVADLLGATCIIMGSHGASGLQKLFGSHAVKIVAHSNRPFIITREGQKTQGIHSIVMPFNFDRESVQITHMVASLAEKFDATIHLVGFRHHDEWLRRDMKTNEGLVRKYLMDHNIKHDTHILPGKESYEKELIAYADSVGADLIAATYFTKSLKSYLFSFVDEMINNPSKIPVLTINAPEHMTLNSRFSFITT